MSKNSDRHLSETVQFDLPPELVHALGDEGFEYEDDDFQTEIYSKTEAAVALAKGSVKEIGAAQRIRLARGTERKQPNLSRHSMIAIRQATGPEVVATEEGSSVRELLPLMAPAPSAIIPVVQTPCEADLLELPPVYSKKATNVDAPLQARARTVTKDEESVDRLIETMDAHLQPLSIIASKKTPEVSPVLRLCFAIASVLQALILVHLLVPLFPAAVWIVVAFPARALVVTGVACITAGWLQLSFESLGLNERRLVVVSALAIFALALVDLDLSPRRAGVAGLGAICIALASYLAMAANPRLSKSRRS